MDQRFLKLFCLMLLCAHLAACTWFFVGFQTMEEGEILSMDNPGSSWVTKYWQTSDPERIDNMPTFHKYTVSWYWAVVTVEYKHILSPSIYLHDTLSALIFENSECISMFYMFSM